MNVNKLISNTTYKIDVYDQIVTYNTIIWNTNIYKNKK